MTEQTPNSLVKVDIPVTAKYGTAQILIFTISGFSVIYLIQFIINHRDNPMIVNYGSTLILAILAVTYVGARSDYALYKSEMFLTFWIKRILKFDELFKYSRKTGKNRAQRFTGLTGIDEKGHLKFRTYRSYGNNKCNRGKCWLVTPSNPKDLEGFQKGMIKLYHSIPSGALQKQIVAQSKDLTNISDVYAKKLEIKDLPLMIRNGLDAKRRYFLQIKDRVGWMYVLFLGIGYYVDDIEANEQLDEKSDTYSDALEISGIHVKAVDDAEEYAVIYSQMFHMRKIGGVM